jgi:hypothetical protein
MLKEIGDTMDNHAKRTVKFGEGSKETLPDFPLVNEEMIPKSTDDYPQHLPLKRPSKEAIEKDSEEEDDDDNKDWDDDDNKDWEDNQSESSRNSTAAPSIHRAELKPNLFCRASLLTNLLNGPERAAISTPVRYQSRSAPSVGISPKEDPSALILGSQITSPKPIITNRSTSHHQTVLSTRTIRKNLLHNEMTESVRKSLLRERQANRPTLRAVSRRNSAAPVYDGTFEECYMNCW